MWWRFDEKYIYIYIYMHVYVFLRFKMALYTLDDDVATVSLGIATPLLPWLAYYDSTMPVQYITVLKIKKFFKDALFIKIFDVDDKEKFYLSLWALSVLLNLCLFQVNSCSLQEKSLLTAKILVSESANLVAEKFLWLKKFSRALVTESGS